MCAVAEYPLKACRIAYGEALCELGAVRGRVVVLDADLAKATGTHLFAKAYPDRFFDLGIAEQNLVGTAAGLAAGGLVPFVSTFALFGTGRAFEQVRNSVCYARLNVKLAATHAGLTVGEDGGSHQSVEDISLMRSLPNMTVVVPADAHQTRQAVLAAAAFDGPVYLRISRPPAPVFLEPEAPFTLGRADVLREGTDVTIAATGLMVFRALQAAEILSRRGLSASVVNVHTIKPLDEETLERLARRTGAVLTVEEHSIIGGLGSAVAEALGERYPVPVRRLGVRDVFGQSGTPYQLLELHGLTADNIAVVAEQLAQGKEGFSRE